ncbi:MAG: hypothetical protein O7E56_02170 [SAR324 cluster bacterium]|nr:hypothetical protein [SAR324 cluster bacterium]
MLGDMVSSVTLKFYTGCGFRAATRRGMGRVAALGMAICALLLLGWPRSGLAEPENLFVEISAGSEFTCALLPGGGVRCWGDDTFGQLGYGDTNRAAPVQSPPKEALVPLGGMAVQISAGEDHACALLSGGKLRCWGDSTFGQLGYGNTARLGDDETPASAGDVAVGGPVAQIAAGRFHTCALMIGGAVRCWGDGYYGQLGYGNTERLGDNELPASAGDVPLGEKAVQVVTGSAHTCALLARGRVRCWGRGDSGQLGYANTRNIGDDEPASAAGDVRLGGWAVQLSAGSRHTCALLTTGRVRCWGEGFYGQLGHGNSANIGDDEHPASAGDLRLGAKALGIASGKSHVCALLQGGSLRCWGNGFFGQLGYGMPRSVGDNELPAEMAAVRLEEPFVRVTAGGAHTCGLLVSGKLRCWGLLWAGWPQAGSVNIPGDNEALTSTGGGDIPVRERFPNATELIFYSPRAL